MWANMLHPPLTIAMLLQGMEPGIDMLAGEALMVTGGADTNVMHFPVSAMPCQPATRFAMLFARQPRWQWEHLKPYLKGLQVGKACAQQYLLQLHFPCLGTAAALLQAPGLSAEALLLRYARKSQTDRSASIFFTAR